MHGPWGVLGKCLGRGLWVRRGPRLPGSSPARDVLYGDGTRMMPLPYAVHNQPCTVVLR